MEVLICLTNVLSKLNEMEVECLNNIQKWRYDDAEFQMKEATSPEVVLDLTNSDTIAELSEKAHYLTVNNMLTKEAREGVLANYARIETLNEIRNLLLREIEV